MEKENVGGFGATLDEVDPRLLREVVTRLPVRVGLDV